MEEEIKNSRRKNKDKKKVHKLLIAFFIILGIVGIVLLIIWNYHNSQNRKIMSEISNVVTVIENEDNTKEYKVNFEMLKEKNADTVGWLKVNDVNVEYPVVQAKDNSYYMTHNFEKAYNAAGWAFADYKNKLDGTDKNIIIYGHNRRDGSMFSSLKNILNKEWYTKEENKFVTFITENENCKYEVFSVYQIEAEDYYIQTNFTDSTYKAFIDTIKKRSIYDFNTDITENDSILTLSTCANNSEFRVVLHAKKVVKEDGEI